MYGMDEEESSGVTSAPNVLNVLMDLRKAGQVTRYHNEPTIQNQTVASHSWGVACLCYILRPEASRELILSALFHDVAEGRFGDPPAPVKWASQELSDIYDRLEDQHLEELGLGFTLTPAEKLVLKHADYLEAMWYCYEERRLGNRAMDVIFGRLNRRLSSIESFKEADMHRAIIKQKYEGLP